MATPSTQTLDKYSVAIGQIWKDSDARRIERYVRVIDLLPMFAEANDPTPTEVLIQSCHPEDGSFSFRTPQVTIGIRRLQTRFKLYRDENGERVYHNPGSPMTSENENVNS